MSYNLYAEGELDLFDLSRVAQQLQCLEVFPIAGDGGPDAIGIALPSKRANDDARAELQSLIGTLVLAGATVFDLMNGTQITSAEDIEVLERRIFGG